MGTVHNPLLDLIDALEANGGKVFKVGGAGGCGHKECQPGYQEDVDKLLSVEDVTVLDARAALLLATGAAAGASNVLTGRLEVSTEVAKLLQRQAEVWLAVHERMQRQEDHDETKRAWDKREQEREREEEAARAANGSVPTVSEGTSQDSAGSEA